MTNKQTAQLFAQQTKRTGKNANSSLYFEGDTIYSYGYHFKIAKIISPKTAVFTTRKYSVTTAKHKNDVMRALIDNGYTNIMKVDTI